MSLSAATRNKKWAVRYCILWYLQSKSIMSISMSSSPNKLSIKKHNHVWICVSSSPGKRLWKLASQLYPLNWAPTDKALINSKRIKSICSISAPETERQFQFNVWNTFFKQQIKSFFKKRVKTENKINLKFQFLCWEKHKIFRRLQLSWTSFTRLPKQIKVYKCHVEISAALASNL